MAKDKTKQNSGVENRMVTSDQVRVRAAHRINEGGMREVGDEWETPKQRAQALGNAVKIIE